MIFKRRQTHGYLHSRLCHEVNPHFFSTRSERNSSATFQLDNTSAKKELQHVTFTNVYKQKAFRVLSTQ